MQIITGYTGENHVTSADDASLYRGILGQSDYVLDVGNKFAATIIDNNTVRIMDGDLIIQGHQGRIRANDYEEVTIDNGTPGQKRNDLIVARYQKNTTTGIENITLEVVKGTPGETATDPDIIQEDLSTGGTQRDFPLYRVSLNGLVLESVTSLFTVLPNLAASATIREKLTINSEYFTEGSASRNYITYNPLIKLAEINIFIVRHSPMVASNWYGTGIIVPYKPNAEVNFVGFSEVGSDLPIRNVVKCRISTTGSVSIMTSVEYSGGIQFKLFCTYYCV